MLRVVTLTTRASLATTAFRRTSFVHKLYYSTSIDERWKVAQEHRKALRYDEAISELKSIIEENPAHASVSDLADLLFVTKQDSAGLKVLKNAILLDNSNIHLFHLKYVAEMKSEVVKEVMSEFSKTMNSIEYETRDYKFSDIIKNMYKDTQSYGRYFPKNKNEQAQKKTLARYAELCDERISNPELSSRCRAQAYALKSMIMQYSHKFNEATEFMRDALHLDPTTNPQPYIVKDTRDPPPELGTLTPPPDMDPKLIFQAYKQQTEANENRMELLDAKTFDTATTARWYWTLFSLKNNDTELDFKNKIGFLALNESFRLHPLPAKQTYIAMHYSDVQIPELSLYHIDKINKDELSSHLVKVAHSVEAQMLLQNGNTVKAVDVAARLHQMDEWVAYAYLFARCLVKAGRLDEAVAVLNKYELDQTQEDLKRQCLERLKYQYGNIKRMTEKAQEYKNANDDAAAIVQCRKIMILDPSYYSEGYFELLRRTRCEEGLAVVATALTKFLSASTKADLLEERAQIYVQLDQSEKAIADLERVLELKPKSAKIKSQQATLLARSKEEGHSKKAMNMLNDLLKDDSASEFHLDARVEKCKLLIASQNFVEAVSESKNSGDCALKLLHAAGLCVLGKTTESVSVINDMSKEELEQAVAVLGEMECVRAAMHQPDVNEELVPDKYKL